MRSAAIKCSLLTQIRRELKMPGPLLLVYFMLHVVIYTKQHHGLMDNELKYFVVLSTNTGHYKKECIKNHEIIRYE
jgi:hypothetical protein